MAFKRIIDAAPSEGSMQFEIEGLRELSPGVFELSGVKPVQLNFDDLKEIIMKNGIEERAAYQYMDEFAELVTHGEVSKALARRMKRIG